MSDNIEYPSVPEMGANLAKFAFDLIKKSMKGDALLVSKEISDQRMEICKSCEYYDAEQLRCRHCGCFLEHKVKWALDSCPIEKWAASDKDWVDGKNILYVNPDRQYKDWYKKIKYCINNPNHVKDMGEAAYELACKRYDIDVLSKTRADFYRSLIKQEQLELV